MPVQVRAVQDKCLRLLTLLMSSRRMRLGVSFTFQRPPQDVLGPSARDVSSDSPLLSQRLLIASSGTLPVELRTRLRPPEISDHSKACSTNGRSARTEEQASRGSRRGLSGHPYSSIPSSTKHYTKLFHTTTASTYSSSPFAPVFNLPAAGMTPTLVNPSLSQMASDAPFAVS
jgi:hypothetical protein